MITISNNRPGELVILGAKQDEIEKFLADAKRALPGAVVYNLGNQSSQSRPALTNNCDCRTSKPKQPLGLPVLNFTKPKEKAQAKEVTTNTGKPTPLGIPAMRY